MKRLIKYLLPISGITKYIVLPLIVFAATFLFPGAAQAICTGSPNSSPGTINFDFGSTIVQRDLPVGSVIATSRALNTSSTIVTCTTSTKTWLNNGGLFTTQSPISGVYSTNIPGVGIYYTPLETDWFPIQAATTMSGGRINSSLYMIPSLIQLIKTGPIPSGVYNISTGIFMTHSVDTYGVAFQANISSGTITSVACTLNNNSINVPLDDVLATSLTSVGSVAKPKNFSMGLTCDSGARVNVQMSGTQNTDTSAVGVLQLTNAGGTGVAKGVGIQILYNNSPLALNNKLVLRTSAGGQETFTFTAQYYQTKSAVTTGSANTTMTLNVTYQ